MPQVHAYRVSRWVSLTGDFNRLRYRRLLSIMSTAEVSRDWLETRSGLSRTDLEAFLQALDQAGVLVSMPAQAATLPQAPSVATPLQQRLAAWAAQPLQRRAGRMTLGSVLGRRPAGGVTIPQLDDVVTQPCGVRDAVLARRQFVQLSAEELSAIRRSLAAALLRHAPTRRCAMHLKVVEHTLRRKSTSDADALPRPVLVLALVQLDALEAHADADPFDATALSQLRSCLVAAASKRLALRPLPAAPRPPSDFDERQRPEVEDAPISDFLACQAAWDAVSPAARSPAIEVACGLDDDPESAIH